MFKRKRRSRASKSKYNHRVEPLERRVLLTTLFGGEVFEYVPGNPAERDAEFPPSEIIRVAVEGDAIIELIAADLDENNGLVLGDLPGVITQSLLGREGLEILGGLGGQDGSELIGPTPINDPLTLVGDIPFVEEGVEDINLQALATNDSGETFAFNVPTLEDPDRTLVQLVQLSDSTGNGTVQSTLHQASLSEDVMSSLSLALAQDVEAFAVDPTTGLAYAVAGPNLFEIERETGDLTFIGPIFSGGFDYLPQTATNTVGADLVGYASDESGVFFSLFDDILLNTALYQSDLGDVTDPNPLEAVNGDLGDNFNFVAVAVDQQISSSAFAVNDTGTGQLQLFEITRSNGQVTATNFQGDIVDVNGDAVTQINALVLDSNGNVFAAGTRTAVNPAGDQEVYRIDTVTGQVDVVASITIDGAPLRSPVNTLAFDSLDNLFATTQLNQQDVLLEIDIGFNSFATSSSTIVEDGGVSNHLVGLASFIDPNAADSEHGYFFSLFDDDQLNTFLATSGASGDTDDDDKVEDYTLHNPVASVSGDLGTNDFNFVGLAVSPEDSDPAFAINNNGGVLELVRINRLPSGSIDTSNPFVTLGEFTDSLGNSIVELNALEMDAAGTLHAVGFNIDAPVPTVSVGGNLGADFDFRGLTTTAEDGSSLFAVNFNGTAFDLYQVVRDIDTGVIAPVNPLSLPANPRLVGTIRNTSNVSVLNISTIESNPLTGELFVIGTSGASPNMEVFKINPITAIAESRGTLMADFDGDGNQSPVTDQINALAFRVTGGDSTAGESGDGLSVTPTMDASALTNALLAAGGNGINITNVEISAQSGLTGATSSGTFVNPGGVYDNIDAGVILSTGDVADYASGPNVNTTNTTAYGTPATADQEALLDPITGGTLNHNDVTQLDITFDLDPGFDSVFFNIVWGTEEFDWFVDSDFIDAFGMYVNGQNVAMVDGMPINVDHPDMQFEDGTELNGVLAPDGNAVLTFGTFIGNAATDNTLTFIIADSGDIEVDSAVYVSGISGSPPVELFAVLNDTSGGSGQDRLVQVSLTDNATTEVSVFDRGFIQVSDPAPNTATNTKGADFTSDGDLLINDSAQGAGQHRFVAVNIDDPTTSTVRTDPVGHVAVNDNFIGLTADDNSRFLAFFDDGPAFDLIYTSPNELFSISQIPGDLDGDVLVDEVQATPVSILNVAGGRVSTDPINALAHNPSTATFFAVERTSTTGLGQSDQLITIDPALADDSVTDIAQVLDGGIPTQLSSLDFTSTLELIGINEANGPGTHQLLNVDTVNPDTSTVQLSPPGSITDAEVGYSINVNDLGFSLFDRDSMNDSFLSGLGDHVPIALGPFSGPANDINVAGVTVINDSGDPNDGRIFAVHNTGGGQFDLHEVLFNANGTANGYSLVGTIQSGGNDLTDIAALEYDPTNNVLVAVGLDASVSATDRRVFTFAVGSAAAATSFALNDSAVITDSFTALAFSAAGTLYGVRDSAAAQTLVTIDPADGIVATVGLGTIQIGGVASDIQFMEFDTFGQLIGADDSLGGALRRGVAINTTQPNNSRQHTGLATLNGSLSGLGVDANGQFVSIIDGSPDTLAIGGHMPQSFVNGDLFGQFEPIALTVASDGTTFAVMDHLGTLELHRIDRNATGDVTGVVRIGDIVDVSGLPVTNILAIDARPMDDALFAAGISSPIPRASVGGSLDDQFDIVALNRISDLQFEAINRTTNLANENVLEHLTITRDEASGAVTAVTNDGEIRDDNNNRILGIDALATGVNVAGFNADAPVPTAPVGELGGLGTVIGDQTFAGFTIASNDLIYGAVEKEADFDLVELVRDRATGAISELRAIGTITDTSGTALNLVVDMFADNPLDPTEIYVVANQAGLQELFVVDTGTAIGTSIAVLNLNGQDVSVSFDELLFTSDGSQLITINPGGPTMLFIDPATAIVTAGPALGNIVNAMDILLNGPGTTDDELIAIVGDEGARQLANIDFNTGAITNLTVVGVVDGPGPIMVDDLFGYQFDSNGRALSVFDQALEDEEEGDVVVDVEPPNDQVWTSGNDLYALANNAATYLQSLLVAKVLGSGGPQRVAVTERISAVAADAGDITAVLDDDGIDRLVTFGPAGLTAGVHTLSLRFVGRSAGAARIQVAGVDSQVEGAIFNSSDQLIALNMLAGQPNHLIVINTTTPNVSTQLTPFGSVDENLRGLTTDVLNRVFSINLATEELWVNTQQLFSISTTPMDVDDDTVLDQVVATEIGSLADEQSGVTESINALAWSRDGSQLFGVRDVATGDTLVEIDATNAQLIGTASPILVDGQPTDVRAMDINFDDRLIALDVSQDTNLYRLIGISRPEDAETLGAIQVDGIGTFVVGMDFDSADRLYAVDGAVGIAGGGFGALDFSDSGGSIPPDTIAAVGPSHVVEMVNSTIGMFDKDGTNVFQQSLLDFFTPAGVTLAPFDPVVAYDEISQRFFVAALEGKTDSEGSHLLYAVSNGSNPTSGFTEMHRINMERQGQTIDGEVGADFPRIGYNADAHLLTFSMFGQDDTGFTDLDGPLVFTVEKTSVLDADPATITSTQTPRDLTNGTMAPATMHGSNAGDPMWLVSTNSLSEDDAAQMGTTVRVTRMDNVLAATPTFTDFDLDVNPFFPASNAEQPGTTNLIQTNDSRMLNSVTRGTRLVAAHTVGNGTDTDVRFYEFGLADPTNPVLVQEIQIDGGAEVWEYFPSIEINAAGDLGMTFIRSSTTEFLSMYVSGQASGTGNGAFIEPILARAGEATYVGDASFNAAPFRAGDFSGITVDPTLDSFWAANEYATATTTENWGTAVYEFRLTASEDRQLIEVDVAAPGSSLQVATPVSTDVTGFSSDANDLFHSVFNDDVLNSALYVSNSTSQGDFVPLASVNGDLGANFDFADLTVTTTDRVFAVNNPSEGLFDLYRLDADTSASDTPVRLGKITDIAGNQINDINALETVPGSESLRFVGRVGTNQVLFALDPDQIPIDADDDSNTDELLALAVGTLTDNGVAVTHPVTALAFQGASLFGVLRKDNRDRFIGINSTTAVVTDEGVIRVNGVDTAIIGLDEAIDLDGDMIPDLVGIDSVGNQLVLFTPVDGSIAQNVAAAAFDSSGQLFVISQDFDGNPGVDASGDGTGLDVALISIDKSSANFTTGPDVRAIHVSGAETNLLYTAMAFQDDSTLFAAAQTTTEDGAVTSSLYVLDAGAIGNTINATEIGDIGDGGATTIDGLAFAVNRLDDEILVGVDNGQVDTDSGVISPRLVSILTGNGNAVAMTQPGVIGDFGGLASIIETGDSRPLLMSTDGVNLVRGSAISLPVTADGSTQVQALLAADFEPGVTTSAGGINIQNSFNGLDFTDSGGNARPDTSLAAGPNHLVQVVNSTVGFFDKTNGLNVSQQPLAKFFDDVLPGTTIRDSYVAYDELAQRFVVAALDVDFIGQGAYLLYAVSNSTNPLDGFEEMHRIQVNELGDNFFEQTYSNFLRFGYNADAHVLTMNMRTFQDQLFDHTNVITIDKSTVQDADPNTITFTDVNRDQADFITMVPAAMHNAQAGDEMWFVSARLPARGQAASTIRVTRMDNVLAASPTFMDTDLSVNVFADPELAEQVGSGQIDTFDSRMLSVAWRNDRLVAAHTIGNLVVSRARWYEINTSATPALTQSGDIDQGRNVWTYFPSIEINPGGEIGMTFMQSSQFQQLSVFVTGQRVGDVAGTMRQPSEVRQGESTYNAFDGSPFDAGRYGGMSVDPVDGTFWAAHEYATTAATNNWGTFIGNYDLTATTGPGAVQSGRLFFVAETSENNRSFLYTLDTFGSSRSAIQNSLTQIPGSFGEDPVIESIAWDESTSTGNVLLGFDSNSGQLVQINTLNVSGSSFGPIVTLAGVADQDEEEVTDITAIEFSDPSPDVAEKFLVAIQGTGAESRLLRINRQSGAAFAIGRVIDNDDEDFAGDGVGPVRGENLVGVTWHDGFFNPITGEIGALLATDMESDELVVIDDQIRPGTADIFAIYVSQSSPQSSISISNRQLESFEEMIPFTGRILGDSLRVKPASGGQLILVDADDGTGLVYIGARTEEVDPDDDDEDRIPIIEGLLDRRLGVRAKGVDDWQSPFDFEIDQTNDLAAGIVVASTLTQYASLAADLPDRMLGFNVDEVGAFAISRDGSQFVAIDTDGVDSNGQPLFQNQQQSQGDSFVQIQNAGALADEVVLITGTGSNIGQAQRPTPVIDINTSNRLVGVQGLDFGDPDFDGQEQLYAIFNIGVPTLGQLDPIVGTFSSVGAVDLGSAENILAMAFAPGAGRFSNQGLFVVGDADSNDGVSASLYEVQYTTDVNGAINSVVGTTLIGPVTTPEGEIEIGGIDFDRLGRLLAHDLTFGRLVDIDLGTGAAGGLIATEAGTLRPTVGGLSYNFAQDQFFAVDNATSLFNLGAIEATAPESAALMTLVGIESDSAIPQDVRNLFVAGTVTGKVDISGSVDEFYAGWLLTGFTPGQSDETGPNIVDNFNVDGQLRNLLVADSIGTDKLVADSIGTDNDAGLRAPDYVTGFDLNVQGKVDQIRTDDSFVGQVFVANEQSVPNFSLLQFEVEIKPLPDETEGTLFQGGSGSEVQFNPLDPDAEEEEEEEDELEPQLGIFSEPKLWRADQRFENDTFDTAQPLATLRTGLNGEDNTITVLGVINAERNDLVDYYSVALMAGQTVQVQLITFLLEMNVGVFDPDNRLIATDFSNMDSLEVQGEPFTFTADRPGEYRIAAAADGDSNFNGVLDEGEAQITREADNAYLLQIDGVGDIALGRLGATENIFGLSRFDSAIAVKRGDLGALRSGANITDKAEFANWFVAQGNLRSVESANVGAPDDPSGVLQFDVPVGSIGLVRGTSSVKFNDGGEFFAPTIGQDIQMVRSGGGLFTNLFANGGIGVISVAGDIGSILGTDNSEDAVNFIDNVSFRVNRDGIGNDGIIDLIDVGGDFNGPSISTGPGGNVRYIRVGGKVEQSPTFGGGLPTITESTVPFTVRDDSGGEIRLTPIGTALDGSTTVDVNGDVVPAPTSVQLTLFGIDDSGGNVIVSALANGSVTISASGFGNDTAVEVSQLLLQGQGRSVVLNADGDGIELAREDATTTDFTVSVTGDAQVDVFAVSGGAFTVGAGNTSGSLLSTGRALPMTSYRNTTGGELVSLSATAIGSIHNTGPIGLPKHHTGAQILPLETATEVQALANLPFPYLDQRFGIDVGDVLRISSDMGIGNVIVRNGSLGTVNQIVADQDRVDDPTAFEGIAGPIYATGNIEFVDIGEGVAESGTGNLAFAGLFADGTAVNLLSPTDRPTSGVIGRVVNQGLGSDIRGDIVATNLIENIRLRDGAIINADIMQISLMEDSREFATGFVSTESDDLLNRPVFEIKNITLTGDGGIIGSLFNAADIGRITVNDGFGIFNSTFNVNGEGQFGAVSADGFGIYDVRFNGGASMRDLSATGQGTILSTTAFTPSVRPAEFDQPANRLNDISAVLGSTTGFSGVIRDVIAVGSRDLGSVSAFQIQGTFAPLASEVLFEPPRSTFFNFANSIKSITTLDVIDNLGITTGSLNLFKPASDVSGLDLTVMGEIKKIQIKGNLLGSSSIATLGANGNIKRFSVTGNMSGDVVTGGRVGSFDVGGNLNGSLLIRATNPGTVALKSFKLGGSLLEGSLDVNGDVGKMDIAHDLGQAGDELMIRGNLKSIRVGTNRVVNGSDLGLNLKVLGDLTNFQTTGVVSGTVLVKGNVKSFSLHADAATIGTNILTGDVTVLGEARKVTIKDGHIGPGVEFTVGSNINRFSIAGNIGAGSTITSSFGNIDSLMIGGGSLFGSVHAHNGRIKQLSARNGADFGDGVNLAEITANHADSIRFDGSIRSGTNIDIDGLLSGLFVGQDLEANATITAVAANTLEFGRDMLGAVALGANQQSTRVSVGRTLGGVMDIDSNTQLHVEGELTAASTVMIGRNLERFTADGAVRGGVFVDGSGGKWSVGSIIDTVITTGSGLSQLDVTDDVIHSLIQIGIRAGNDDVFAALDSDRDLGEQSAPADFGRMSMTNITDSIVAAAGSINHLDVAFNMVRSSVSSGLSVGSVAIATVLNDPTPLALLAEQDAARSGTDRALFHGDFNQASIAGNILLDSALTAGVDAGADGRFGTPDDNVLFKNAGRKLPDGGGRSSLGTVSGFSNTATQILADSAILSDQISGTANRDTIGYTLSELTADLGNPLEPLAATVIANTPLTFDGLSFSLTGVPSVGATVDVHDNTPGDGRVDSIVIRGTNDRSELTIAGGGAIGRILGEDDVQLRVFSYDGTLDGDGVEATPDLWFDGTASEYSFGVIDDGVTASIGGDVDELGIGTFRDATFRVGGKIKQANIVASTGGNGLLNDDGMVPSIDIAVMSTASNGDTWVFDSTADQLSQVDPTTGAVLTSPVNVADAFTGNPVTLDAMDFDHNGDDSGNALDDNLLLAAADVFDPSPTRQVGSLALTATAVLRGLAVSPSGQVVAIENTDRDRLVEFDTSTGTVKTVGEFRDIFNNDYGSAVPGQHQVLHLAFDNLGRIFGLVRDLDGTGPGNSATDGVALVMFESTDGNEDGQVVVSSPSSSFLPGVLLDDAGSAVTDDFTAMAVNGGGVIHAIRRVGSEDHLVTISLGGTVTTIGTVKINGADANIIGMGFNESGNLIAYDNDGLSAQLILVDTVAPATLSRDIADSALLNPQIDGFGIARSGTNFATFAYDSDDVVAGQFFTSAGQIRMLGTVDLGTGQFNRRAGLTTAVDGSPLTATVSGLAVDHVGPNHVFVSTDDSQLFEYEPTDGSFVQSVGNITNTEGETLDVRDIEFLDLTGDLIGVEGQSNQLVTIDKATGQATARIETGSLRDGVDTLAYDVAADTLRGVDGINNLFVSFNGTTHDALQGGLTAQSIDELNITGPGTFTGRITTTGNSFGVVSISGDFAGSLASLGTIKSVDLTGTLLGTISAQMIHSVHLIGPVAESGMIIGRDFVDRLSQQAGDFGGSVQAEFAGSWQFKSAGTPAANLIVNQDAGTIAFTGNFDGNMEIGEVTRGLKIDGELGATATIVVENDLRSLDLGGGTEAGGLVAIGGRMTKVRVSGDHSGHISAGLGIDRATLNDVSMGLLASGMDSSTLTVQGDSDGAVYSFGVSIGPDLVYNTTDDLIIGGSLRTATFRGKFTNSVLAVGVLPNLNAVSTNANNLPDDNRAFSGNNLATDVTLIDPAEAGGVLASQVGRVTMRNQIFNSSLATGQQSAVVTADGVLKQTKRPFSIGLAQRTYEDPFGAPTIVSIETFSDRELRVVFSEPISTASLSLATDGNDDGDIDDVVDTPGSILLRDNVSGEIIDGADVTLSYLTQIARNGTTQGVLRVTLVDGMSDDIDVALFGNTLNDAAQPISAGDLDSTPTVFDRSGLRSALRNINQDVLEAGEDLLGTVLDGDGNGVEGSNISIVLIDEVPDDFVEALAEAPVDLAVDMAGATITSAITNANDIDVYRFRADAFEFFTAEINTDLDVQMGVFVHDNQGTPNDSTDDTFEMLTRWETNIPSPPSNEDTNDLVDEDLFMAFELPPIEEASIPGGFKTSDIDYFVVVAGANFKVGSYELDMNLASTDVGLGMLPPDEVIPYISNTIGENNNQLGAIEPKQLVYLNFDGGVSTKADPGLTMTVFDATDLNPLLVGLEDLMINGGTGTDGNPVVGIVDLMAQAYSTTPASHPLGQLNVQTLGADLSAFLVPGVEGLFLTTVDPVLSGLSPATDYTTLLFGSALVPSGRFGVANIIDFANVSKADEALIFVQNHGQFNFAISDPGDLDALVREFAKSLASTAAHELGHVFGLNHTLRNTLIDDPNNDGDAADSVLANLQNIVADRPQIINPDDFLSIPVIGTAGLSTDDFVSVGGFNQQASIDSLTNLLYWLS